MNIPLITNWAVGAINGYVQKENGLPNSIKYGTIGITTFMGMIKVWSKIDPLKESLINSLTPRQKLLSFFIASSIVMTTQFYIGHHMGKAVRFAEDDPRPIKNGGSIHL